MEKEPLFTLTKHDLEVTKFTNTEGSRPLLSCVMARKVGNDRVELVATDGYTAILHKIPATTKETFEPFLIPGEVLEQVKKLIGSKKQYINQIYVFADRIELRLMSITIAYRVPEGDYPIESLEKLIRDNIQRKANTGEVKLNPNYVMRAAQFLKADSGLDIKINDKLQPVEFQSKDTYIVIMPLKS